MLYNAEARLELNGRRSPYKNNYESLVGKLVDEANTYKLQDSPFVDKNRFYNSQPAEKLMTYQNSPTRGLGLDQSINMARFTNPYLLSPEEQLIKN